MYMTIIFLFANFILINSGISIPYISNIFLQSSINFNITVLQNRSCEECLCENFIVNNTMNYIALNCLTNQTCEFFQTFPISYKLNTLNGSRLYFLQKIYPNASKCCMPNITELIIRLNNTIPIIMNLTFQPSGFGYDSDMPSEAAVIGWDPGNLFWFNPLTMIFKRNSSINDILTLALYNNQTFTASNGIPLINIRDSQTNNYLGNINYPTFDSIRKVIFINNGQTLLVSTQNNKSLTVLNANSPLNYTHQEQIYLPLANVHGIAKVNDTFLYVSSWVDRRIVSCQYENSTWTNKIFVNTSTTGDGSHIAVDECERVWFVNTAYGLRIYDSSGAEIASLNIASDPSNNIYDILLLRNYVLLVSYYNSKKIVQYDPLITCT